MKTINRHHFATPKASRLVLMFIISFQFIGQAMTSPPLLNTILSKPQADTTFSKQISASHLINAAVKAYLNGDKSSFSDGFMQKAVLIDASGNMIIGQNQIQRWGRNVQQYLNVNAKNEILNKHIRTLSPDLVNITVQLRMSTSASEVENVVAKATLSCLCRRIDGKWYYEMCTILPVSDSMP